MAVLEYDFTIEDDAGPMQSVQLDVVPLVDDIDRFVDVDDLATAPAVEAFFTPLVGGLIPEACARVLCVTMFNANSGAARGISLRIWGKCWDGKVRSEVITFTAKAANTTNITFTRYAYVHFAAAKYLSRNG